MYEERLGEIGLDSDDLMVYIVIVCIIPSHELERVKRKAVSTMVVDGFQGRETEEKHRLARGHAGDRFCKCSAERVKEKALYRVIIKCSESVRDI